MVSFELKKISDTVTKTLKPITSDVEQPKDTDKLTDNAVETLDVAQYHTGGGWYKLPNGERVQGKHNAIQALEGMVE